MSFDTLIRKTVFEDYRNVNVYFFLSISHEQTDGYFITWLGRSSHYRRRVTRQTFLGTLITLIKQIQVWYTKDYNTNYSDDNYIKVTIVLFLLLLFQF